MRIAGRSCRVAIAAVVAAYWFVCAVPVSQADDGFVKDATNGCAVFKPNLKPGEAVVWKGACANGNAEGNGVARWTANDGTTLTFEGRFSLGKLQGVGTMVAAGGDRYEGAYKDGKREGHGVYLSANGDRFEGAYKENQRHGQGTLVLAAGNRVLGEWRNGVQVATKSEIASPPVVAANPVIAQPLPLQLAQPRDRQSQLVQRAAQDQAARELREQQRAEAQQRQQLAAQQRTDERQHQQQLAQQAAQERQNQTQLAQTAAQEERRQRQLTQQLALDQKRRQDLIVLWSLLTFPIVAAALIAFFKASVAVSASNKIGEWIGIRQAKAKEKSGLFTEYFMAPILWCAQKLFAVTASIGNPFLQAGVRIATWLYLVGAILFLIFWVTAIVLATAMLVVGFWVLGAILSILLAPVPAAHRSVPIAVPMWEAPANRGSAKGSSESMSNKQMRPGTSLASRENAMVSLGRMSNIRMPLGMWLLSRMTGRASWATTSSIKMPTAR